MGSASRKRGLIQGQGAKGDSLERVFRASPLAAQHLRTLPVPGREHGRVG